MVSKILERILWIAQNSCINSYKIFLANISNFIRIIEKFCLKLSEILFIKILILCKTFINTMFNMIVFSIRTYIYKFLKICPENFIIFKICFKIQIQYRNDL